ncbi:MAG: hypothetical protein ACREH6_10415 [Geminicoccaceae bacterium]
MSAPIPESAARRPGPANGDQPGQAPGFTAADLAWERCQEQAALAFRVGDAVLPPVLWARGLEIAQRHLTSGDPRLASSLTNHALALRRGGEVHRSQRAFKEAIAVWEESWRWIHLMTPAPTRRPRNPESDELPIYRRDTRELFLALASNGQSATEEIERFDRLPKDQLDTWFQIRPRRFSDLRKLLGAVLLIAPCPR